MPIYEYRCGECGQEHEVLQKVSEPPLTECPACGKPALKKQLSAAGFQLKGSGWHATDYGRKEKPPKKSGGKPPETSPEKPPETSGACKDSSKKPECSGCPSAS